MRRFQISHALIDHFTIRDGWTTLVFVPSQHEKTIWNGVCVIPNALGIVRSSRDHEVRLPAGWSTLEIDIADHLIDSECLLPDETFSGAMTPERGQLRLSGYHAYKTRRTLLELFDKTKRQTSTGPTEKQALVLRRQILDVLAAVTEFGCHGMTPQPSVVASQARFLVRNACRLLDTQLHENPQIEFVATELHVTTRSLQRCFHNVLGVTPKQYFLARKLDAARRTMRQKGHRTTVVDISHAFGFTSASRFAEQFHRHFGHTPSTTVRFHSFTIEPRHTINTNSVSKRDDGEVLISCRWFSSSPSTRQDMTMDQRVFGKCPQLGLTLPNFSKH